MAEPSAAAAVAPDMDAAPRWARMLIAMLLLAPVGLAVQSLRDKSWTWDEPIYLAGGHYLYHTGNLRNRALSFHPPLAMYWNSIGLLPLKLGAPHFPVVTQDFAGEVGMQVAFRAGHDPERVRMLARLPFVALIPLLGGVVYLWSRELWGWRGGLLSLWIVAWNPTLLAHARWVATDYLFTLCFLATLWSGRGLLQRGGALRIVRTGVFAGLALLAKFSAVILVPQALLGAWFAIRMTPARGWRTWAWGRSLATLCLVGCLAFGVLWVGYLGEFGVALTDPNQRAAIREASPPPGVLGGLMYVVYARDIPLPAMTYFMGFFSQYAHGAVGHSNYLLGDVRAGGWWQYFPVAILTKTPLPELALWALGGLTCWKRGVDRRELLWLLAGPAVLLVLSAQANINIGVRHVLPLYPVAAIVAGAAVPHWRSGPGRVAWLLCAAALLVATVRSHPHYLTYFNGIAGGPERGHRVLVDSNLDWGQDVDALFARAQQEGWLPMRVQYFGPPHRLEFAPEGFAAAENPCEPTPGYYAVSVTHRVGAYMPGGAACLQWLDAYEPIARIHNTIWVYHIPDRAAVDGPA